MPVYNGERFVVEALQSVLSQSYSPQRVIVVDDGSTDSTPELLREFGEEVTIIRQQNTGHPGAYNTGFGIATTDFVARCDADDVWEPTKLERQIVALVDSPAIDIAFTGAMNFGVLNKPWLAPPGTGILDRSDFTRAMYRANFVCSSSALIRKQLFDRVGPFKDRLPCEDYDFWLRALRAGAVFHYDPELLVRYRRHSHNVTNNLVRMHEATHQVHQWHAELVDDESLRDKVLADDRFRIARALVADRRLPAARAAFMRSLRHEHSRRNLAWALVLSTPEPLRVRLTEWMAGAGGVALS